MISIFYISIALLIVASLVDCKKVRVLQRDYLHRTERPPMYAVGANFEPGIWRPVWIIDRTFYDVEEVANKSRSIFNRVLHLGKAKKLTNLAKAKKVLPRRILIRLRYDRTIQIIDPTERPFLSFKTRYKSQMESQEELSRGDPKSATSMSKTIENQFVDMSQGVWQWESDDPLDGIIDFETREEDFRVHHEVFFEWGECDDYALHPQKGRFFPLVRGEQPPLLSFTGVAAGEFTMSAHGHRIEVTKDFLAHQ